MTVEDEQHHPRGACHSLGNATSETEWRQHAHREKKTERGYRAKAWARPSSAAPKRLRGRALQALRKRVFSAQPLCPCSGPPGPVKPCEELDHVIPLSKGGSDDRANLQGLCRACHAAKTALEEGRTPPVKYVKGCDANGRPLDPGHPWRRTR